APALADAVEDGAQPLRVRQEAALALGRIATAREVERLAAVLRALASDVHPDAAQLRRAVVQGLARSTLPAAREALHAYALEGPVEERPLARWLLARGARAP
ncbi:MAG TPA: hypothetical protein VFP65_17525, partial [Anaeromyxobacteraceae bacterium]|nr:hypothetical protein [Anaeromyxobacteraceae bacterium]